ncbi:MAG: sigma-B regulation protein RsbU (phosphoserine phosphatase) [Cyclobacteriaceae bacterium]|jgi:sigma-B regulation protein RsbU (phosphoserine phosphatase)
MQKGLDIRDLELNALLEITQAINNNFSEEDLYKIYRFTLLADLKVKKLALFVKDEDWMCKVHFGTETNWSAVELNSSFLNIHDTTALNDTHGQYKIFDHALPVSHKNDLLAVLFIGGLPNMENANTTFLKALTNIIIVAIENKKMARRQLLQEAHKKEMEIAKKVQNFLFPKTLPKSNRLKIEAVYLPHQDVGGDYYDYISIDQDKFLICIADVSGKGVPAALLMSNFQASLRTLIRKTQDLEEIVSELNHIITMSGNMENFITFFVAIYDYKICEFEYISCGHNPLYLVENKQITELNNGTTILGMFDPLPFLNKTVIKEVTDFLFFGYTDGLSEAFNSEEEQFGEDRIKEILIGEVYENLDNLHFNLLKSLDEFRKDVGYNDDITILSCLVRS